MNRVLTLRFLTAWCVVTAPLVASAADEAGADSHAGGGHADVIQVDPFILGFAVVVFVLVMFFLKKNAWGPLIAALEDRERKIEEARLAAEQATAEADRVSKEHQAVLGEARAEATAIVEAGKRKAEEVAAGIRSEARVEAEALKRKALAEIGGAREKAVEEIHQRSVELALEISEKLVGKQINASEHRGLIDDVIQRHDSVAS
ncbi:MAG: F0F1 ATP synthase subunit B [Planctomycetota bacterium]